MELGFPLGGSLAVRSQAVRGTFVAVVGRRGRAGHRVVGAVGVGRTGMRSGLLRKGRRDLGLAGVRPYLLD